MLLMVACDIMALHQTAWSVKEFDKEPKKEYNA